MLSRSINQFNQTALKRSSFCAQARQFSSEDAPTSADLDKVLHLQHTKDVFEFKLNSPKTLNSLSFPMCQNMLAKLKQWHGDDGGAAADVPRTVLISGSGGKAFCAGGDIVDCYRAKMGTADASITKEFFAREYLLDYQLHKMDPRYIAIWNGITMGGGVGLTWHAPIRIATDNTMYAMPETAIGFFCDVGGSYFLSHLKNDPSLGLYLGMTGHRLKGQDLLQWGVATHFVPQDKMESLYSSLKNEVTQSTTDAQIDEIVLAHSNQQAKDEPIANLDEIHDLFQLDSAKEIVKRVEQSTTETATRTNKLFSKMSPLSLEVAFEQIKRGKDLSIKETYEMEYKMSQGFMDHTEFFEGVRALLVDKDKNPQWKHKHVNQVSQEEVDFFFNREETIGLEREHI